MRPAPSPWWKLFNNRLSGVRPTLRTVRRRSQPELLQLEERLVPSTVTFVQNLGTQAQYLQSGTTMSITTTGAVVPGDSIIVEFALKPSTTGSDLNSVQASAYPLLSTGKISTTALFTFHNDAEAINASSGGGGGDAVHTVLFYGTVPQGGLPAGSLLTMTFPSSTAQSASAEELRGLAGYNPLTKQYSALDVTAVADANTSAVSTAASPMTHFANEALIGAIGVRGQIDAGAPTTSTTTQGFTAGTNYTVLPGNGTPSGNAGNKNASIHPEIQVVHQIGSYVANGTLDTNAGGPWAALLGTYLQDATTHLVVSAVNSSGTTITSIGAGQSFSLKVTAEDADGTVDEGYTGTIHFTTTDMASGVVLPVNYTFNPGPSGDDGSHTFSGVVLQSNGSQTITATDLYNTPTISGSTTINVLGPHLSLSAPASTTAGLAFSLTVTEENYDNSTNTGYRGTVHFTSTDLAPGVVLPANYMFTATDMGVHTFTGVVLDTAGNQTITGNDTLNTGIDGSTTIDVTAAAANHLAFGVQPSNTTAGVAINPAVTVDILDQYNNLTTSTATVGLTPNGPGGFATGSTTSIVAVNGVATFSNLVLDTAGMYTLSAASLGLNSATSNSFLVSATAANHLAFAQQPSNTTAGSAISPPVTVDILDQFNNLTSGTATIGLTPNGPGGFTAGSTTNVAAVNGVATFSNLVLDTAGTYTLGAASSGLGSATSSSFVVSAATATHFAVSAPSTATAGSAFNFTVTAEDQYNNTATAYAGLAHFTSSDGAAVLPNNSTLTSGVGTFSATLKTAGNQTITATDTVTSSITGTSNPITVSAATATHFVVSAPSSATAGSAFNFTVTAEDQYNNTATAYAGLAHFTSSDSAAVLPNNSTLTSGLGTFSATLKTVGNQTITATDTVTSSITGTSNPIAVSAAAATHFVVSAPSSATAGSAFNFTVTAEDQYNNTATAYAGTVHFTSSDGQAVLPANSALTSGIGTFSATLKTAGNQTITATDTVTSSITGTSSPIAVSAAAATHFVVSAPSSATAGSAFSFTVTAEDPFNNKATAYAGLAHFTSSDGAAVLPANSTLTSGVGTFSATLKTAGNQTITATDTVTSSITGTSNPITVSAATATHFVVSAPSSATAGSAFNFTVTAEDQYNNTATAYTGLAHFTSSDGAAVLPANSTLTSGIGTFSATLKTAGNQTITATDTVTSSITGTSNPIAVSAATATHFVVSAPSSATAGSAFSFTVTAEDAYNNATSVYAGTVHFTSSDGQAVLPANTTLTSGIGTFSATLKTAGNQTITATDTVTSSITGTSNPIAVSAASATHFAVSAPSSATAGSAFSFTVTAEDQYNNTATAYAGLAHFTSSDGAAVLPSNSTLTSGIGTFSATLKTAGNQTITATDTVTSSITGTSNPITVSAAAATHFSVSAPTIATAGSAFNFTVTAEDPFNNTATAYGGTVHFTSSDGAAVLPSNSTLTSGIGTLSATLKTAGNQTITATDTVTSSITGTSNPIAVGAAAATHFAVSAPSSATAGSAFSFTVMAEDQFNNTATAYAGTAHFTSSDVQAALSANSTLALGIGTFSATLKTAGNQTITATDIVTSSITGTSNPIAVSAASATHFAVSAPSSATAGSAFSFTVTAEDQYNNTATAYAGLAHFTSSDGAAVLPSNSTLTSGIGTFSATLKTAGNQTITATDTVTSSTTGTSNPIAVSAAAATHFTVSAPSTATAGSAFNFTVTAQDQFNNTATAYAGTVHFTSSDGQAVLPANSTLTSGIGTLSATLKTAGNQTITATDTVTSSITGTSNPITVSAAAANHLAFGVQPSNTVAGTAISPAVTVQLLDQFNNLTTSTATISVSPNGPGAFLGTSTLSVAAVNGVATFSNLVLTVAGSYTISALSTGLTGATSNSFTVSAAAADHFSLTAPAMATAGSPFSVTLEALDPYGNLATGYTGTAHFSSTSSPATLPVDYVFMTADGGEHTFSNAVALFSSGSQTLTATDTKNSALTGSATINVIAAAGVENVVVNGAPIGDGEPAAVLGGTDAYSVQRSKVNNLLITFIGTVTLDPGAISVTQYVGTTNTLSSTSEGLVVTTKTIVENGITKTQVIVQFTGSDILGGSLSDGNYLLRVDHTKVHFTDGSQTPAADLTYLFYRLFGDSNGDRTVNDTDVTAFQLVQGLSPTSPNYRWYFDYDEGSTQDFDSVNTFDYYEFNLRYKEVLPPPS